MRLRRGKVTDSTQADVDESRVTQTVETLAFTTTAQTEPPHLATSTDPSGSAVARHAVLPPPIMESSLVTLS